jgi:phage tail-like protein
MENTYQVVGFHFAVHFSAGDGGSVDIRFQSIAGLDSTIDIETIKEGGENRFEHVIPTRRKFGPLVLKRGLVGPLTSPLANWLKKTFEGEPFDLSTGKEDFQVIDTVLIDLLGEDHQPLMSWTVTNVWPRSWKIAELNAERSEVLIETLELNYNRLIFSERKAFNIK